MPSEPPPDPTALTPDQLAVLLTAAAKRRITREMVDQDVAAGAPTNGDGTVNLVHYTAWLAGQVH